MKKIIAIVVILMVALNILALMPKSSTETEADKKECSLLKRPKIELTELNPGILPNLLKS